ncbi:MAG: hypothetical protein ABI585_02980 [Betaproteobacteria bacterium]
MSALDPRHSRWLAWLAPFTVLALAIGVETGWGNDLGGAPPEPAAVAPAPVTTAVVPEFRIEGGLDAMKSTVDRPLFNASRRPAPPAVAEAQKPVIQRGQYLLTGTLITDKGAVAFLKETSGNGKARSVRKGDSVNGMLVAEVAADRVKLTLGDESEDVELKVAKGPKSTVQVAAVAPAAAPGAPQAQGAAAQAGAGAQQRRPATQSGAGASPDARENVRAARRSARQAEAQSGAAAPAADGAATNPPQPSNSWQDTYQRMQRRPR